MSVSAYIGLGSNLDNPLFQVKSAISELNACEKIVVDKVSAIYKSKPLEINSPGINSSGTDTEQADYINAAVKIKTTYSPLGLLDVLQSLEKKHNRVKQYRWGPRSLDLDILLYDSLILETERLSIPHIELIRRDFVVYPLYDINPALAIPGHGKLVDILSNFSKVNLVFLEHYDPSCNNKSS
ncbi:2-amino-4-hydroxy-6-hydroxymethyldihydropteridine diphosphokinase [Beggiatoa alba]|nr:2-amino-4-hydroxy-6-hydroxymethyldihydropteridine diphosphokinase [Beggiatoa alba]